jgi:A/G-specific adenine glycosylase
MIRHCVRPDALYVRMHPFFLALHEYNVIRKALPEFPGIAPPLLAWYDRHARTLPWRVSPEGPRTWRVADPYRVWLSEIMLQQTTVQAVKSYFNAFVTRWPTVNDLAAAETEDVMKAWAGLGYYSRARNLKKCADQVAAS